MYTHIHIYIFVFIHIHTHIYVHAYISRSLKVSRGPVTARNPAMLLTCGKLVGSVWMPKPLIAKLTGHHVVRRGSYWLLASGVMPTTVLVNLDPKPYIQRPVSPQAHSPLLTPKPSAPHWPLRKSLQGCILSTGLPGAVSQPLASEAKQQRTAGAREVDSD